MPPPPALEYYTATQLDYRAHSHLVPISDLDELLRPHCSRDVGWCFAALLEKAGVGRVKPALNTWFLFIARDIKTDSAVR